MKIKKNLLKIATGNSLDLKYNNSFLYIIGKYGINYFLINDLLFIKALEYFLFYNQFASKNNVLKNLLARKIKSSSVGWFIELTLIGLGFRVKMSEIGYLLLNLGYSHAFAVKVPKGINLLINKERILLFSFDLILLGNSSNLFILLIHLFYFKYN